MGGGRRKGGQAHRRGLVEWEEEAWEEGEARELTQWAARTPLTPRAEANGRESFNIARLRMHIRAGGKRHHLRIDRYIFELAR